MLKTNKKTISDFPLILAIETSCDETAAAVTRGREVLSSAISSQIEIHRRFGGVVPEIASRNHVLAIDSIVKEALCSAEKTLDDIDVIAVTEGGGLLGALLVGVSFAKTLAYAKGIPLMPVNHIKGHTAACFIADMTLKYPFISLVVSGGHTEILKVKSFSETEVLGKTRDDAAGEAFDKVARVLGLPYPGGPEIEKLAASGNPTYPLPRAYKNEKHLDFSFSGLKTAVINTVNKYKTSGGINAADLACSFQDAAVSVLVDNVMRAAKESGITTVTLAGGVAANTALRNRLSRACSENAYKLVLPPKALCTDNAAMIGVAAFEQIKDGSFSFADLTLDANPAL